MAIKDWKKTTINLPNKKNYGWKWKKGLETIRIYKNKTKRTPHQKNWNYSYSVWFNTKDRDGERIFLNKTKALAYAKAYMRRH